MLSMLNVNIVTFWLKEKKGGEKKKKEKKREFNLVEDLGWYWDCIVIYYHVKIPILPKV